MAYPLSVWQLKRNKLIERFIRLDLTQKAFAIVTCLVCNKTESIAQTDEFIPHSRQKWNVVTKKYNRTHIANNKAALQFFQEQHYNDCIKGKD